MVYQTLPEFYVSYFKKEPQYYIHNMQYYSADNVM